MKDNKIIPLEEALALLGRKKLTLPLNSVIEALKRYPPDHLLTIMVARFLKGQEATIPPQVTLVGERVDIAELQTGQRLYDRLLAMTVDLRASEKREIQILGSGENLRLQPLNGPRTDRHVNGKVRGTSRSPRIEVLEFAEEDKSGTRILDISSLTGEDKRIGSVEIGMPFRRALKRD